MENGRKIVYTILFINFFFQRLVFKNISRRLLCLTFLGKRKMHVSKK